MVAWLSDYVKLYGSAPLPPLLVNDSLVDTAPTHWCLEVRANRTIGVRMGNSKSEMSPTTTATWRCASWQNIELVCELAVQTWLHKLHKISFTGSCGGAASDTDGAEHNEGGKHQDYMLAPIPDTTPYFDIDSDGEATAPVFSQYPLLGRVQQSADAAAQTCVIIYYNDVCDYTEMRIVHSDGRVELANFYMDVECAFSIHTMMASMRPRMVLVASIENNGSIVRLRDGFVPGHKHETLLARLKRIELTNVDVVSRQRVFVDGGVLLASSSERDAFVAQTRAFLDTDTGDTRTQSPPCVDLCAALAPWGWIFQHVLAKRELVTAPVTVTASASIIASAPALASAPRQ